MSAKIETSIRPVLIRGVRFETWSIERFEAHFHNKIAEEDSSTVRRLCPLSVVDLQGLKELTISLHISNPHQREQGSAKYLEAFHLLLHWRGDITLGLCWKIGRPLFLAEETNTALRAKSYLCAIFLTSKKKIVMKEKDNKVATFSNGP